MNNLKELSKDIAKLKVYLSENGVSNFMLESPCVIEYIIRKINSLNLTSIPLDEHGNIIFAGYLKQTILGFAPIHDKTGNFDVIIISSKKDQIEIISEYTNINFKERFIIDSNTGVTKAYCIFNTINYVKATRMTDLTIKVEILNDNSLSSSVEFIFDNGNPSNLFSTNSFKQNFNYYVKNYPNLVTWYKSRYKNCTFDIDDYSNFSLPLKSLPFFESILNEKSNNLEQQKEVIKKLECEFISYISKINDRIKGRFLVVFLHSKDINIAINELKNIYDLYCKKFNFEIQKYSKDDYHDEVLKLIHKMEFEIRKIDELYNESEIVIEMLQNCISYLKLAFNTRHLLLNGNKIKRILNGVTLILKNA